MRTKFATTRGAETISQLFVLQKFCRRTALEENHKLKIFGLNYSFDCYAKDICTYFVYVSRVNKCSLTDEC